LDFDVRRKPIRILCLGAHCDDIEIGCGGAILKLAPFAESIHWVAFSGTSERKAEASASASQFLQDAHEKRVVLHNFRDSFFPYEGGRIKEQFEALKQECTPDLIFTHYGKDLHQDHRLISELTWNTFRDHFILEYEIAKYDADLGSPNAFYPLERETCKKKISTVMSSFKSQAAKGWFTEDTFLALMRLRGIESNSPGGFAEGFYCRKVVLAVSNAEK